MGGLRGDWRLIADTGLETSVGGGRLTLMVTEDALGRRQGGRSSEGPPRQVTELGRLTAYHDWVMIEAMDKPRMKAGNQEENNIGMEQTFTRPIGCMPRSDAAGFEWTYEKKH